MKKRRSDVGHLTKEQYDALESRGGSVDGESVLSTSSPSSRTASQAVLSGRKIVRASRKWKQRVTPDGAAGAGAIRMPSAGAANPAPLTTTATTTTSTSNASGTSSGSSSSNGNGNGSGNGSNPFAKTSLVAPSKSSNTSTPKAVGSSNPFSKVSFAPASTPVNATIGRSDSSTRIFATSTKKPRMSADASLGADTVNDNSAFTTASSMISATVPFINPLQNLSKDKHNLHISEKTKLNLMFLRLIQKHAVNVPLTDWSAAMNKYLKLSGSQLAESDDEEDGDDNVIAAAAGGGGSAEVDEDYIPPEKEEVEEKKEEDRNEKGKVCEDQNYGVPASKDSTAPTTTTKPLDLFPPQSQSQSQSPLKKSASSGTTTSSVSKPSFSFGGSPKPAAAFPTTTLPSKPFTGFTFGNQVNNATATASSAPAPAPAPAPVPISSTTKDSGGDGGGDENGQDSKTEEATIMENLDENEEKLYKCAAKYYIQKDGAWVAHKKGNLGIYRDKTTQKCKIVLRDPVLGKVMLNVAIAKGMAFSQKTDEKKKRGMIYFSSIRDENVGMEMFMLCTNLENFHGLYAKLQSLAT